MWPFTRGSKEQEVESRDNPVVEEVPPIEELLHKDRVASAVWNRSWQHPLVVFPLAIGTAAATWCGLIDFGPQAFGVALIGVLGGGAAYVTNYFFRGEKLAGDYVNECRQRVETHRAQKLDALKHMADECEFAGFESGAKEAREVTAAYERLMAYLESRSDEAGHLSVEQWRQLAEDSFREAMSLIARALALYTGLTRSDTGTVRKELRSWRGQLKKLKEDQLTERDILGRKIQSHVRRLQRFEESGKQVEALLAEANELESALDSAYLEVVDLLEQRGSIDLSRSTNGDQTQLSRALEAARRVEERLGRIQNPEENEEDLKYGEVGRRVADQ